MKTTLALIASVCLLGLPASASAAELGDPAPALQIAEWIKGKPVDLAAGKGKKIFVVEFWATWCPPCRASIPHLTELQKKFKARDVVFVGISDEKVPTVKKFVEQMGDKMDYVVAVDKERKTGEGYMEAFGINGIPHAFIVDKQGRIAWNGHPMADLEETLNLILDGKYDLATAKKRDQGRKLLEQFYELAAKEEDAAKADKVAKEIEVLDKEVGGITPGKKFDAAEVRKVVRFRSAMVEYQRAVFEGKPAAETEKLATQAEALAPSDFKFAEFKDNLQLQRLFQDYYKTVTDQGEESKTPELARQIGGTKSKNAMLLNELAWTLLTDEKIKQRDPKLAMKLAQNAFAACDGKNAAIVDTYARALFDTGKVKEAITYQKKAIQLCEDKEQQKQMEEALKTYEKKAGRK